MAGASSHLDEPIIFGNNWPNRTTDMAENVPPKLVFWLSFIRYGFFEKKKYTYRKICENGCEMREIKSV